jgi:hypothetical protein
MIKFKAGIGSGRELVGFGLTEKNVEQMKLGRPIHVMGVEMGIPYDVMIFYGETERAMYEDIKKAGLIDPERTVIHDTSDKPKPRN